MARRYSGRTALLPLIGILLGLAGVACEGKEKSTSILRAGEYWDGGARIGMDGDLITGNVDIVTEGGNRVCQFRFDGMFHGKKAAVSIQADINGEPIEKGEVILQSDSSFRIRTESGCPCAHVYGFHKEPEGHLVVLQKAKDFRQVRRIQAEKAYFYEGASLEKKKRAYLVKENDALVFETKGPWLKVKFGKTTGWIQEGDFYALMSK